MSDFDIENVCRTVQADACNYVGFVCDMDLRETINFATHIDELGENNGIEIVEIKFF